MRKKLNQLNQQQLIKYNFSHIDVIGILGRRGCGKSHLCKLIQKIYPRKIVFDTVNEYDQNEFDYVCMNFDQFAEAIIFTNDKNSFKILVRFSLEESRKSDVFNHMLRLAFYRGDVLLVIEEIHNFCSPQSMPLFMENLFFVGRHQNIAVIYTTQRPATLNKKILSQSTKIFSGCLFTNGDLLEVKNAIGNYNLSILKNREFIYWTPENGTKPINNDLTERKNALT